LVLSAIALGGCGDSYAWDDSLSDSARAERVDSLLSGVDAMTGEAVGSRGAEVARRMTDDEIVASAASICAGLHEGHDTEEVIDTTSERVPEFHGAALGIIGPPAVEFFCPDLAPQSP